jgi:periplasmic mercuric ion binding protein
MKSILNKYAVAFTTLALSISALAETATFTVEGMHCGGCKKMITKAVCSDSKISATLSECKVTLDEKTKTGTVILKSKETAKIDAAAIETAITSAGEDYKVSKKEIKN